MGFTLQDLVGVRDRAIRNFTQTSSRCRLPGMNRDFKEDEIRVMSFVEASIVHTFMRAGLPVPDAILAQLPQPFTASQEPVEGYDAVPTVTPAG